MTRRRILSNEESDVHTGWRRYLAWCRKPGRTKAAKRRTNRRERREGVAIIRRGDGGDDVRAD